MTHLKKLVFNSFMIIGIMSIRKIIFVIHSRMLIMGYYFQAISVMITTDYFLEDYNYLDFVENKINMSFSFFYIYTVLN
jgi:hypothetical protein